MLGVQLFDAVRRSAEARLSRALGGTCALGVSHALSDVQRDTIITIDGERFREELRYTRTELEERSRRPGFTCFLLYLEGKPIAYDYGYDDDEQGSFYSDSAATLIERRGVGSTLSAIEALYCHERGYSRVKLFTEERDEIGRELRQYWERFGFRVVSTDEDDNIVMVMELTMDTLTGLYDKYIAN